MKLFVWGLDADHTVSYLAQRFERFGAVNSVRIYRDGRKNPFAIVEMPWSNNAEEAISEINEGEFRGNHLKVKESEW